VAALRAQAAEVGIKRCRRDAHGVVHPRTRQALAGDGCGSRGGATSPHAETRFDHAAIRHRDLNDRDVTACLGTGLSHRMWVREAAGANRGAEVSHCLCRIRGHQPKVAS